MIFIYVSTEVEGSSLYTAPNKLDSFFSKKHKSCQSLVSIVLTVLLSCTYYLSILSVFHSRVYPQGLGYHIAF